MRSLFRSGAAFMIVAGLSFMAAALMVVKALVTGNGSPAIIAGTVAIAVMWLVIGYAVRSKNTT